MRDDQIELSPLRITVITVAYNSAGTIADTLRSVAAQSHPDIEHIVVDGGSNDATLDLIKLHGRRVSKLISERDRGIYDAMNKGIALATGDMVGFLNADDTFAYADAVADIADAASQNPGVVAVFGDLEYVDQHNPNRVIRYWRSGGFKRSRLRFGWMPPHPTFYVRSTSLASVGTFDLRFRIAADYDFVLRCLTQPEARAAYVEKVLVRMRTGGISNRSLVNLVRKSREDLTAIRKNGLGGLITLVLKNLSKLSQYTDTKKQQP